ncbi:uncharacterized protein I206_101167 [Kwoniella pini CBS 10737]|uniref:Cytoplasmic protein n=1 Tax=Kwoniella pini CBS 10737 TaxID=1296096 RepID=A0A1B9IBT1_9TREE|nr:uncharacterized protein I206_00159 [Kwoniella pini CBS 10737]OCF52860.1 hypothetical protein I206_00159 [Kwoniella pini CBS 10737]
MVYELDPLPRTDTPSDYTRFKFNPTNVGDKRIVGLLACQRDPLLRSLTTKIHSIKEASIKSPPPPKGKNKQKKGIPNENVKVEEIDKRKLYEIELLDTVIFPEGGGQPSDTGHIKSLQSGNNEEHHSFVIEGCLRKKLDSVHLVRVPPGQVINWKEGEEVEVHVDWERRVDHTSCHTSQHLLSAILDRMELPTLSWSMHAYPSLEPIYVELPRALTPEEAEQVEKECNDLIMQNNRIWVDISVQGQTPIEQTEQNGNDDDNDLTTLAERLKVNKGIPEDYEGGVIRHINIDRTDRNACCGTQFPSLSHVSLMHVIPPTTTSSSSTKLYFVAGPRAIRYLQQASRQLSAIAKIVGSGRADVIERLENNEKNRKELFDNVKDLKGELSNLIIEKSLSEDRNLNKGIIWIKRENEKSTHEFEFLGTISGSLIYTLAEEQNEDALIIITSTLHLSKTVSEAQTLVLISSKDDKLAKGVNETLKKGLGDRIKGGGARGRYMSKISGKWGKNEDTVVQGLIDELRAGKE